MPQVLILDKATRDEVLGPSTTHPNAHLDPVALTDGRYILGTEVLDDPAHAEVHDTLAACEVVDYDTVKGLLPPSGVVA